jgi:hypothetical protein
MNKQKRNVLIILIGTVIGSFAISFRWLSLGLTFGEFLYIFFLGSIVGWVMGVIGYWIARMIGGWVGRERPEMGRGAVIGGVIGAVAGGGIGIILASVLFARSIGLHAAFVFFSKYW